jgi:hopene-associated glycosyltransferase HpnB
MLTTIALLNLLIWCSLLFARGTFWLADSATAAPAADHHSDRVAVVVPARNEATVVGECISSLLKQTGIQAVQVFLVDDGSTDGTAQTARAAAMHAGKEEALTIIAGQPLPPGWSGKLWAVQQGVEAAQAISPDFLLLTDADIVHAPESLATLVSLARSGPFDLVSFMVKLHCSAVAEKILIPAFVFFFFMLYPPRWISNQRRSAAGAAGGSILLRPEWLERAGGIFAIRNEIIDDCALAKRVKATGGRLWLGLTTSSASVRRYDTFTEVGRMISRTAFNQLGHSAWILLGCILGLAITYFAPPLLLLNSHLTVRLTAGAAMALMVAAYLPMVRFYRLNPLWALTLPLAALFYMGATLHSAAKFWSGRGGEWKGRIQDPAASG